MAKIQETIFIVKLSQLVRNTDSSFGEFGDLPATLEQVVQELVPGGVIVEVEAAE